MFYKSALAATALTALLGTAAAADSYFGYEGQQDNDSVIELGEVVADSEGVVVIYDYNTGEFGDVLGETPVAAGANADVRIDIGSMPNNDVAAVLYLGEVTTPDMGAAWIEIDIESSATGSDEDDMDDEDNVDENEGGDEEGDASN